MEWIRGRLARGCRMGSIFSVGRECVVMEGHRLGLEGEDMRCDGDVRSVSGHWKRLEGLEGIELDDEAFIAGNIMGECRIIFEVLFLPT
jgi:hypothetical protein